MPEESAENHPEYEPDQSDNNKQLYIFIMFRRFWPAPKIRIIIYSGVTFLTVTIGAGLLNNHPKPVLVAWSLILIGCLFAAFAARLSILNHKTARPIPRVLPNLVCFVIVLLALIGCAFGILQEQPIENKPISRTILPWQPPLLPDRCDAVSLEMGGGIVRFTNIQMRATNQLEKKAPGVTAKCYVIENRFYVDLEVTCAVVTEHSAVGVRNPMRITVTRFSAIGVPPIWHAKHDEGAFEIVDDEKNPLLQFYYKSPDHVVVEGNFRDGGNNIVMYDTKVIQRPDIFHHFVPIFDYTPGSPINERARHLIKIPSTQ